MMFTFSTDIRAEWRLTKKYDKNIWCGNATLNNLFIVTYNPSFKHLFLIDLCVLLQGKQGCLWSSCSGCYSNKHVLCLHIPPWVTVTLGLIHFIGNCFSFISWLYWLLGKYSLLYLRNTSCSVLPNPDLLAFLAGIKVSRPELKFKHRPKCVRAVF